MSDTAPLGWSVACRAVPYRAGYGQQYEMWHFADQRINWRHDPTREPMHCEDCPKINPWRVP